MFPAAIFSLFYIMSYQITLKYTLTEAKVTLKRLKFDQILYHSQAFLYFQV